MKKLTVDDAITVLECCRPYASSGCGASDEEIDEAMLMGARALEQTQWIPVDEGLPKKNMPCLVSIGKFNLTQIAMYSDLMGTIDHKIFYQGDFGYDNFEDITEYVKAWIPLPEPYKEE